MDYFKAGFGVFFSKDTLRPFKDNSGFYMADASQT